MYTRHDNTLYSINTVTSLSIRDMVDTNIYTDAIMISEKEPMNLKESEGGYMRESGGRKEKGEIMPL